MDKKQKFRVVVIVPVIATVIIAGLAIYFVLQVGASGVAHKGVTYSPEMGEVADPADMAVANNEEGAAEQAPASSEAECNFPSDWVGKPVDEEAVKAVGRPYRILAPDSAATMDFSPERLNVMIDDKKVVTAVRCG
jgi:hypothetical protein